MFYTIYKITNQIDGKSYIGSHKTKNLNDNYMGSGKYLKYAQKKYGIENFQKEILFVFETAEEMYAKEAEIVNENYVATENTYNLKVGGFGGWDYTNELPWKMTENRKNGYKERSKKLKGRKDPNSSIRLKKLHEEGKIQYNTFTGRTHKEESKRKIGNANSINQKGPKNSQFGTMWITNGTQNKKIKKTDVIPKHWNKGRSTLVP